MMSARSGLHLVPADDRDDDVLVLLELGLPMWDRLAATVIDHWTDRLSARDPRCDRARPALTAALYGRVTVAARSWLGDPGVPIDVAMIDGDDEPTLTRDDDGLTVRLPFRWLRDIWVPGLAVVLGRFALWAIESVGDRQQVMTAGADPTDTRLRPVTISLG
jgi:hypothetical protein